MHGIELAVESRWSSVGGSGVGGRRGPACGKSGGGGGLSLVVQLGLEARRLVLQPAEQREVGGREVAVLHRGEQRLDRLLVLRVRAAAAAAAAAVLLLLLLELVELGGE